MIITLALSHEIKAELLFVLLSQFDAQISTLDQLRAVFGTGPLPVGELVAAGLGGARYFCLVPPFKSNHGTVLVPSPMQR